MLDRFLDLVRAQVHPSPPISITVLVPGSLSPTIVERILDQVPSNLWSFQMGTPIEEENWHIWHEWHHFPFPLRDQTLILFSSADYPVDGAAGGCAGTRYAVAVFGNETDEVLGLRCWHELLHGLPGSESADAMVESTAFREFLAREYPDVHAAFTANLERYRHDPRLQRLFYTMLTNAFTRRTGRNGLSLPPAPRLD